MDCLFKWVHVSDLHFQAKDAVSGECFNSSELKRELPQYLSAIQDVDALIISGDYRFGPNNDDNPQKAVDFIKEIASALKLDSSQVHLVPGNHDLSRGVIRNDVIGGIRSTYSSMGGIFDAERLRNLQDSFVFYEKLGKLLYGDHWTVSDRPHRVSSAGKCNLLLINTALTAGKVNAENIANDEHHLLIGTGYLAAAIEDIDTNKPTIAVGHHGLEYLEDKECKACTTRLEKAGIMLYLCGHTHKLWSNSFGDNGKEISVGCLMQQDHTVDAGFAVGQLMVDGTVSFQCHKWDNDIQKWYAHTALDKNYEKLYTIKSPVAAKTYDAKDTPQEITDDTIKVQQNTHPFSLKGYMLLGGRGIDGIKYIWEKNGHVVESLAFNKGLKDSTDPDVLSISAYTSSVSFGCQLSASNMACRFCETGTIGFSGNLCAEDIALQNIFMAEYDSDCPSFPQVRCNKREFAFMGQGEPGFCYPTIRRAIQLTDYAMSAIDQDVSRYIISTCGVPDFVPLLISDIKGGVFKNRITLHFSLHTVDDERNLLMPINKEYDYKHFIQCCERYFDATGEKIGVGILMFNKFSIKDENNKQRFFTLTPSRLEKILKMLNKDVFRIDLCDVNCTSLGNQSPLRNEDATKLLALVKNKGFEGKVFSSFGDNEQSGCGMLSSSCEKMSLVGNTTITHYNKALELLAAAEAMVSH